MDLKRPSTARRLLISSCVCVALLAAFACSGSEDGTAEQAPPASEAPAAEALAEAEPPAETPGEPVPLAEADTTAPAVVGGSLVRLDAATGEVVATIPLDGTPLSTAADERGVWVVDDSGTLSRIDAESNDVTATFEAPESAEGFLDLEAAGEDVLLTRWLGANEGFEVLHLAAGSDAFEPVDLPTDIVWWPVVAGGSLWVSVGTPPGPTEVLRVDPETGSVIARLEGLWGYLIAAGDFLWVADLLEEEFVRLDTETNEPSKPSKTHFYAHAEMRPQAAFGDGMVWVQKGATTVFGLDRVTGEELFEISVPPEAGYGWLAAAGGGAVWVASESGETLYRLQHPADPAGQLAVDVGGAPLALAVAGDAAWVGVAAPETDHSAEAGPAPDYSDDAAWICRPGREDVCAGSLDITMVSADGSTEVVAVAHAADAPIGCFYVYPTVSQDNAPNSDLGPGEDEELAATLIQAARFGSVCDVYVPVYRQTTLALLFGEVSAEADFEMPYGDVRDAFRHYLANDSAGRGFVLIGHSQGADLVSRLIREEIAGVPALRERLVSAIILGPPGSELPDIPPCTSQGQVGCLLSYATYDAASPPPPGAFGAGPALCTNPAALAGGSAPFHPAFVLGPQAIVGGTGGIPFADSASAPEITTAWVGYPEFLTGECVDDGAFGYLSVTIHTDPADPRTDDLAGDALPDIGLHHLDGNIALDDLVAAVAAQAESYGT